VFISLHLLHITYIKQLEAKRRQRNETDNVCMKVTLRYVRATIVAVTKQYASHIPSVCL